MVERLRQAFMRWGERASKSNHLWPGLVFALFLAAFGISWLNPADQFALSANYRILAVIASESAWGISAVAFALAWIVALVFRSHTEQIIASFSGGVVLLFIAISIYIGNPISTWSLPTFVIGCGAIYNAARMWAIWTQR